MTGKLLLIMLAGGFGALARYGLSGWVHKMTDSGFPWGTMVVNIVGCFVFGLLVSIMDHRLSISDTTRAIILIGFMGAFTTFSTFAFETVGLLRDSQWLAAGANIVIQNVLGVVCLIAGFAAGRAI